MPETTLRNAVDTFALNGTSSQKAAPHPNTSRLRIRGVSGSAGAHPFLYFNRPFPLGATILEARMGLYTSSAWNLTTTVKAYMTGPWKASKLNWNNAPATVGSAINSTHTGLSNAVNDLFEFDLQAALQGVSDGDPWNGVMLDMTSSAADKMFWSANASSHKPYLFVKWAVTPAIPAKLSPSGGRAVSIAKPVLRSDFTDSDGGGGLAALNDQISTSTSFVSPTFDSGWVASTTPSLDTSRTDLPGGTFAGIALDAVLYWRRRVKNVAGLESGWSDPVSFTRKAKGTISLLNPAASPNDFVTEPTPPIIFDFVPPAGATQEAFEVKVFDNTTGAQVHTSGYQTSTEETYTLPLGVLNPVKTYRVDATGYDTVDRESTPGDPAGVTASRTFTVSFDDTVVGVTGLSAHTADNRLVLTWDRATAPDSFVVTADGVPVVADLDPADLLTTGTSYRYELVNVRPRTWIRWDVQAVVNGAQSEPGPGVPEMLVTNGVWVTDTTTDVSLYIAADGNGDWNMGEDGETFFGLGSTKPVRITQAVRGWEDTLEGFLITANDKSMLEWYEIALGFRSRPGSGYVMQVGNEAFEMTLHDTMVPPTGGTSPTKRKIRLSFEMTSDPRHPVVL